MSDIKMYTRMYTHTTIAIAEWNWSSNFGPPLGLNASVVSVSNYNTVTLVFPNRWYVTWHWTHDGDLDSMWSYVPDATGSVTTTVHSLDDLASYLREVAARPLYEPDARPCMIVVPL